MGVLRTIGESIGTGTIKNDGATGPVFKKNGKYYEKLDGEEITADEVAGRTVIQFGK